MAPSRAQRLGRGHVTGFRADTADPVRQIRHLLGRTRHAEPLEAAEFRDLKIGVGHLAVDEVHPFVLNAITELLEGLAGGADLDVEVAPEDLEVERQVGEILVDGGLAMSGLRRSAGAGRHKSGRLARGVPQQPSSAVSSRP